MNHLWENEVCKSLSARRAWIEIRWGMQRPAGGAVALRKESVDRNYFPALCSISVQKVALRKESVDRNLAKQNYANICTVALRKESVDRN